MSRTASARSRRSLVAAVAAVAAAAASAVARDRAIHWGATCAEARRPLPGDELVRRPSTASTRAVTIAAPPAAVWPWLVQMGQDRGGLYSYDRLERLLGLDFSNADRIVPEWQRLQVGDQIRAARASAGPEAGFTVVAVDPVRSLVTVVGDPGRVLALARAGSLPDGATWTFVLEPLPADRTRLLIRFRARFGRGPVQEWLLGRLLEPVHFVMERKQLLGIRDRAEGACAPRTMTAPAA